MNQVFESILKVIETFLMNLKLIRIILLGFLYKIKFLVIVCLRLTDNLEVPQYLLNRNQPNYHIKKKLIKWK